MEKDVDQKLLEKLKSVPSVVNLRSLPHRVAGERIKAGTLFVRKPIMGVSAYVADNLYRESKTTFETKNTSYEWFSDEFVALHWGKLFADSRENNVVICR